jgi:hypothetical protein
MKTLRHKTSNFRRDSSVTVILGSISVSLNKSFPVKDLKKMLTLVIWFGLVYGV